MYCIWDKAVAEDVFLLLLVSTVRHHCHLEVRSKLLTVMCIGIAHEYYQFQNADLKLILFNILSSIQENLKLKKKMITFNKQYPRKSEVEEEMYTNTEIHSQLQCLSGTPQPVLSMFLQSNVFLPNDMIMIIILIVDNFYIASFSN